MNEARQLLASLLSDPPFGDPPNNTETFAWERLLVTAEAEGVAGLLLEAVERDGWNVSANVVERLRASVADNAARNTRAMHGLARVAAAFAEQGIDLLVLKGAALLPTIYGAPGLRPMCDVDLLIRPADAEAADELLHRLDIRRGKQLLRDDFYPRYHYEAEYLADGPTPLRFDVHVRPWRPLRYARIVPPDAFWSDRRPVSWRGAVFQVPGDADMLLHLVCHAAFHGAKRLLWAIDVRRWIDARMHPAAWSRFVSSACAWRLAHAASFALDQVEAAVGRCVPRDAKDALAAGPVSRRDRAVLRQAPRDRESPWRHVLVDLLCTPGVRFRLGYLRAVAFPAPQHLAECYSRRHPGWTWCARILRLHRALRSLMFGTRGVGPVGG